MTTAVKEQELSIADKERINVEIKSTMRFYFFLFAILFLIMISAVLVLYVFFDREPIDGYIQRLIHLLAFTFFIYLIVTHRQILMFVDLKLNRKKSFDTKDYTIDKMKYGYYLNINRPSKLRLRIFEDTLPLINTEEPITVEMTKLSCTILNVTQNQIKLFQVFDRVVKD